MSSNRELVSHAKKITYRLYLTKRTQRTDWDASWRYRYSHQLLIVDLIAVLVTLASAHCIRFGAEMGNPATVLTTLALAGGWLAVLAIFRTRSPKCTGFDSEEFRRIVSATCALFGAAAIVSFALDLDLSRGFLAMAAVSGTSVIVAGRLLGRRVLASQRRAGRCLTTAVVVGSRAAATAMNESFGRDPSCGYSIVAVCVPRIEGEARRIAPAGEPAEIVSEGDERLILGAVEQTGADIVIVTATQDLGEKGIRSLLWALDGAEIDLVVSLGVADVAKRRLSMRPVANLPLMYVERPAYSGAAKFGKTLFDMSFAVLAIAICAPVLVVVAAAVKLTSAGPVLYRSERIGLGGEPFQMLKFRTMVDGADRRTIDLLSMNDIAGDMLFKIKNDPRITPLGKTLRKLSIDELPQFYNVLMRHMSVVGPRPPLRREVERYDDNVGRRLLVKPGITGLWQVSGRSDLSWDETTRLDQSYVENWSMAGDAVIVAKTVRAVVRRTGAY